MGTPNTASSPSAPIASTDDYVAGFADFITASPSSYHAAEEVARRLEAAGFERLDETRRVAHGPRPAGRRARRRRDRLGAAGCRGPDDAVPDPRRAHRLALVQAQAQPDDGERTAGCRPASRCTAARCSTRGSTGSSSSPAASQRPTARMHLVRTGPLLRIPQLAIHLDRKVNEGLTLDKQRHLQPVWGVVRRARAGGGPTCSGIIADAAGVEASDIVGHDLLVAGTQAPSGSGSTGRSSPPAAWTTYVGLRGTRRAARRGRVARRRARQRARRLRPRGARLRVAVRSSGPFLDDVLTRIGAGLGAGVRSAAARSPRPGASRRTPATPCTRTTPSGTTP